LAELSAIDAELTAFERRSISSDQRAQLTDARRRWCVMVRTLQRDMKMWQRLDACDGSILH
jgi:hypothetical protein